MTPCRRRAATAAASFLTMSSRAMISSIMMAGWTPGTCSHEVIPAVARSTTTSYVAAAARS